VLGNGCCGNTTRLGNQAGLKAESDSSFLFSILQVDMSIPRRTASPPRQPGQGESCRVGFYEFHGAWNIDSSFSGSRKLIRPLLIAVVIFLAVTTGKAEDLLQADTAGRVQANLQHVSLEDVSAYLEQRYAIKFAGNRSLLQTEVTVSFEKLSLDKAIKRIFSKLNVVYKYDNQGKITEINLLPAGRNTPTPGLANNYINNQPPQGVVEPEADSAQDNDVETEGDQADEQENVDDQSADDDQAADQQNEDDQAADAPAPLPDNPASAAAAGPAQAGPGSVPSAN
jgi:hypothetical protein